MQFIYTKGIEGENLLYFGNERKRFREVFKDTELSELRFRKEVWHRQDGRKRNKEYSLNKPSLFLDF